jgi:hypothetical protein
MLIETQDSVLATCDRLNIYVLPTPSAEHGIQLVICWSAVLPKADHRLYTAHVFHVVNLNSFAAVRSRSTVKEDDPRQTNMQRWLGTVPNYQIMLLEHVRPDFT